MYMLRSHFGPSCLREQTSSASYSFSDLQHASCHERDEGDEGDEAVQEERGSPSAKSNESDEGAIFLKIQIQFGFIFVYGFDIKFGQHFSYRVST
jgi:hypothetical protein